MKRFIARSYDDLRERLKGIQAGSGRRLLFRGQDKHYSGMKPSFSREECRPARMIPWQIVADWLAGRIQRGKLPPLAVARDVFSGMVVQHYGYISPYLDVTESVEVALWFAMHKLETPPAVLVIRSDDGSALPADATLGEHRAVCLAGVGTDPTLYVFEVEPVGAEELPMASGRAVCFTDLLGAGWQGTRIQAQGAWGIFCDPKEDDGLWPQCVARIELGFRYEDVPSESQRTMPQLFPGPAQDAIYRTLLSAPLTRVTPSLPLYERPVGVSVYYSAPETASIPLQEVREIALQATVMRFMPSYYWHMYLLVQDGDDSPVLGKTGLKLSEARPMKLRDPLRFLEDVAEEHLPRGLWEQASGWDPKEHTNVYYELSDYDCLDAVPCRGRTELWCTGLWGTLGGGRLVVRAHLGGNEHDGSMTFGFVIPFTWDLTRDIDEVELVDAELPCAGPLRDDKGAVVTRRWALMTWMRCAALRQARRLAPTAPPSTWSEAIRAHPWVDPETREVDGQVTEYTYLGLDEPPEAEDG